MQQGYHHLPWHDTPASSGIRPGLRTPGLTQRQHRCVAPENWVKGCGGNRNWESWDLWIRQAALWGSAGRPVSTQTREGGKLHIRSHLFKWIRCVQLATLFLLSTTSLVCVFVTVDCGIIIFLISYCLFIKSSEFKLNIKCFCFVWWAFLWMVVRYIWRLQPLCLSYLIATK